MPVEDVLLVEWRPDFVHSIMNDIAYTAPKLQVELITNQLRFHEQGLTLPLILLRRMSTYLVQYEIGPLMQSENRFSRSNTPLDLWELNLSGRFIDNFGSVSILNVQAQFLLDASRLLKQGKVVSLVGRRLLK